MHSSTVAVLVLSAVLVEQSWCSVQRAVGAYLMQVSAGPGAQCSHGVQCREQLVLSAVPVLVQVLVLSAVLVVQSWCSMQRAVGA